MKKEKKRYAVMFTLGILIVLATSTASGQQCNGNTKVRAYFTPGQEISDVVKLRYKFYVAENEQTGLDFKILFAAMRTYAPEGSGDTYLLESNIYARGLLYNNPVCTSWPLEGTFSPNEASLRVAVPDYVELGKTGAKTLSTDIFPRQSYNIDNLSTRKTDMISQINLNSVAVEVIVERGPLIDDKTGWKCEGNLDETVFRQWKVRVTIDCVEHTLLFALPDANAQYLTHYELLNFFTEFYSHAGLFKVYLWDFQFQRENTSAWEPIDQWIVNQHCGDLSQYGSRLTTFNARTVIEISNDASSDFLPEGTVFNLSSFIPNESEAEACAYSLSSTNENHSGAAESGSFQVTSEIGCSWTATKEETVDWITLNTSSGNNCDSCTYSVSENTGTSPRSADITVPGQVFTVTQDKAFYIDFAASSQTINESDLSKTVNVELSNVHIVSVTVPITISGGTATNGSDYTVSPNTVVIPAGTTAAVVTITVINDTIVEANETISISLGTPTNALLGIITGHTATITDDDFPQVSFQSSASATANEGPSTHSVNVALTLSGGGMIPNPVTVEITDLPSGTATSGSDYSPLANPTTLTFPTGSGDATTQSMNLSILQDFTPETNETINLQLGNLSSGIFGSQSTHQVTITDDDVTTQPGTKYIDQYQLVYDSGPYFVDQWQSFTAGVSNPLSSISVYGKIRSESTLYIYEGEGTSGTLLHTQTVPEHQTRAWINIILGNAIAQQAGSQYTFRFVSSGTTNNLWWDTTNPYAGGRHSYNAPAGQDMAFKTYVCCLNNILLDLTDVGEGNITRRAEIHDGEAATMAFDNTTSTKWLDNAGVPTDSNPSWIDYELTQAATANVYSITSANDATSRDPKDWRLLGYDSDLANATVLDTRTGITWPDRKYRQEFTIANSGHYKHYRLEITANYGGSSMTQMSEIEIGNIVLVDLTDAGEGNITRRAEIHAGEAATKAFDNTTATKWLDNAGQPTVSNPSWIDYELTQAGTAKAYSITSANDVASRDPKDWRLLGYDSVLANATVLDTRAGIIWPDRKYRQEFTIANPGHYKHYRLEFTANYVNSMTQMSEIEILGN